MARRKWLGVSLLVWMLLGIRAAETTMPVSAPAVLPQETFYVALTFDDGPRRGTTDRLLDGLRQRGASATFFLVGNRIDACGDLVERMRAEGHQVGNHTWSHVRLQGDAGKAREEVLKTDALLRKRLGEGRSYWLRPPYGLLDESVSPEITVPLVKWSVDPEDWKVKNTPAVVQSVLKHVKPNSIILLHDIYNTSVDAALQIVDALQEKGYVFVTVEELLALNGVEPQAGVFIRNGDPPA